MAQYYIGCQEEGIDKVPQTQQSQTPLTSNIGIICDVVCKYNSYWFKRPIQVA